MQAYGVLPRTLDPARDLIDGYAADEAYGRSFRWQPIRQLAAIGGLGACSRRSFPAWLRSVWLNHSVREVVFAIPKAAYRS
jgi:hypothetical protein